jgi:hypothetical protein
MARTVGVRAERNATEMERKRKCSNTDLADYTENTDTDNADHGLRH